MKRRRAIFVAALFLLGYFGSYLFCSRGGYYVPEFGCYEEGDGRLVISPSELASRTCRMMGPKPKSHTYRWHPFEIGYSNAGYEWWQLKRFLFMPLIILDSKIWHSREKAVGYGYPVPEYLDLKKMKWRRLP